MAILCKARRPTRAFCAPGGPRGHPTLPGHQECPEEKDKLCAKVQWWLSLRARAGPGLTERDVVPELDLLPVVSSGGVT